jgi:hypothetical protein
MSKIYSKKYAEKLIRDGKAIKTTTVTQDGKQYQAISRMDTQEVAHYKLPTIR